MKTKILSGRQPSFFYTKPFRPCPNKFAWVRFYALIVMVIAFSSSSGQTLNKTWKEDLTSVLEQFLKCTAIEDDKTICNSFIEKSLGAVYKLDGLYIEASNSSVPASGFAHSNGNHWSMLGKAYEQGVLEKAQNFANENKAVIAVYRGPEGGVRHIAIILPGILQYSGSWGFNVPNSASFFITTPEKSYICKGLSYAFAKNMIKDVTLLVRNK